MGRRTSTGPQSSRIDDLSLPSLDDLLADSSDTDPEGLFSGFKGVSNNNLDTFSRNDLARVQCNCTGIHSCCPEPQSSSDNEQSSTAPHHVALSPASTPLPKQQQHSANTQGRSAAAHLSPPQSTLPAAPAQAAPLNLAGLTAAQVASAVGFTGQLGSTQQPAAATSRQQPVSSSFVKSPARSHRKRTRDLDPSSAPQTTPAVVAGNNLEHLSPPADADALPSSNSAGHSAAGIDTARSGSPDINSSIAGTSGQEGKQHSSSQDSAQPDDEQKRQVRKLLMCVSLMHEHWLSRNICLPPLLSA